MDDESLLDEEDTGEQAEKQPADHLKPWQFKPGVSGNPSGRPIGRKSLKTFAREYLESLSDGEKLEYMKGMDKKIIWEMSEGKAKQDLDIQGEMTTRIISVDE